MAGNRAMRQWFMAVAVLAAVGGCGQGRVLAKGQKLYARGRYNEAIEVFVSLASAEGEVAEHAQLYLGFCNFKMGRHEEAIRQFELVPQRFPQSEVADDARYWTGRCFEDWERPEEALAAYRKAVEATPPSGKANMALRAREAIDMLEAQVPLQ